MEKINAFWNWFRDNNNEILNLPTESDHTCHHMYWLNEFLNDYCPKLYIILIFPKNNFKKPELIISSKEPEHYHAASVLVAHAPKLPKWNLVTLQLPCELEIGYKSDFRSNVIEDINLKRNEPTKAVELEGSRNILVRFRSHSIICSVENVDDALTYYTNQHLKWKSQQELSFVQLENEKTPRTTLVHIYEMQYYLDNFNRQNLTF